MTTNNSTALFSVLVLSLTLCTTAAIAGKPNGGRGGKQKIPETFFPQVIGATDLHNEGITGEGIGVAILDTSIWTYGAVAYDTDHIWRLDQYYDAVEDFEAIWAAGVYPGPWPNPDESGHGSHMAGVMANSEKKNGSAPYNGVAPDVDLIIVRAFGGSGEGAYADVIRGIDWIVANKDLYNIRVLNLSFSAPAQSHYWDDPLNQAVMAAWQAGIVVVASAGNTGPDPMTIGVPGNLPYADDDFLASFSAAGPTYEGFVKPELVAPGGHVVAPMSPSSTIATEHPEFVPEANYFTMSGTSQAAAVVSGVVALILQAEPGLAPDYELE